MLLPITKVFFFNLIYNLTFFIVVLYFIVVVNYMTVEFKNINNCKYDIFQIFFCKCDILSITYWDKIFNMKSYYFIFK